MKKILALTIIAIMLFTTFTVLKNFTTQTTQVEVTITPTPQPTIKPSKSVSFVAAGDNLIHGSVYLQAKARATQGEKYNFDYTYANTQDYIAGFDVKFINQETLVTDAFEPASYPMFSSPIQLGKKIVSMGFNAIGLSNNHSYDKGVKGVQSTIDFWDKQNNIEYFGFYTGNDEDDIKYLIENDIKIAFLAYTFSTNGLNIAQDSPYKVIKTDDYATIQRQVEIAKANSDIVIVSCHWGTEDSNVINSYQKTVAKKLNEFGVDVIIGTHPHVIQGIEWVTNDINDNKTLVAYSLGNFISAQSQLNNMLGGLFQFDIVKTYTDLEDNYTITIQNPYFVPTITHYDYNFANIRNYLLKDYTNELSLKHGAKERYPSLNLASFEKIVYDNIPKEFLLYK